MAILPFQSEFIQRADSVTQKHITFANEQLTTLNSIMTSLRQTTSILIPNIEALINQSEPDNPYIPSEDIAAIFRDDYQGQFGELKTWFADLKSGAIETFFPYANASGGDLADSWIAKAISGEAINLAEDAEIGRGRTRIFEEAQRAKKQASAGYSALGYVLPPGAMLAANQEADFAANRGIAELNSNLTIEAQKVRKELVMFAVGQVNNLRGIAAQGLTGYLNAFASLPGSAAQYASQKSAAKQALWDASKNYYQSQLGYKNLLLETGKANMQADITHAQLKVGVEDKQIERDLKSLQVMVEVVGRLVAGAMAGINSHISLGANSNANLSESHSYNHET